MKPRLILLAMAAAAATTANAATVKDGVDKWQAGDAKGAVAIWQPLAARGDADALFNIGQAYKLGRGVTKDLPKAKDFYRRAAAKGHAPAATNYGIMLAQDGKKIEAANEWTRAAAAGEPRAQYMMGVMHFNGDAVAKDWPLAYAYMLRSNNAGFTQAATALATMNGSIPIGERNRGEEIATAMANGSFKPQPAPAPVAAKPAAPQAAPKPATEKSAPATASAMAPARKPPAPVPATPATESRGDWRVQLGAYSQIETAREGWNAINAKRRTLLGERDPIYAEAPGVVRLQLGGFADKGSAQSLCRQLDSAGQPCFVVKAP